MDEGIVDVAFPVVDRKTRQTMVANSICPEDGGQIVRRDGTWNCKSCSHDEIAERKKNN